MKPGSWLGGDGQKIGLHYVRPWVDFALALASGKDAEAPEHGQ